MMITATDIDNKRFEQAKPGYKPEEVDEFLKEVSDAFRQMQKDKEETEKKMLFLVETVKKYKQDEEAIKDAMIYTQKQAKEITSQAQEKADALLSEAQVNSEKTVSEAKQKAEQIIASANVKSEEIIGNTSAKLEQEKAALAKLRREVGAFRNNLLNMYREHLGLINNSPGLDDEEEDETAAAAGNEEKAAASAEA